LDISGGGYGFDRVFRDVSEGNRSNIRNLVDNLAAFDPQLACIVSEIIHFTIGIYRRLDLLDLCRIHQLRRGCQQFFGIFRQEVHLLIVIRKISSLISPISSEKIQVHDIESGGRQNVILDKEFLVARHLVCELYAVDVSEEISLAAYI
jgi:hypothetical protein